MKKQTEKTQTKTQQPKHRATIENIPIYCAYDEIAETETLKPHPKNPNEHPDKQVTLLAHIIRTQGWRAPITISKQSGYIIRGHGRLAAANKLNLKGVPVEYQNYPSKEAEWADLIADNKIGELANMNAKKTAGLIEEMNAANFDLTLTGLQADEILDIIKDEKKVKEDNVITTNIKTKPGDLYQLGPHKLLCGDATNKKDIETLMGEDRAQLVFTDPPYGVEYESEKHGKIINDKLKENTLIELLLLPAFKNCRAIAKDDAAFFIWYANLRTSEFEYAVKGAGLEKKQTIIWLKQNFVLSRADYHYNYEPCIYAQKIGHRAKVSPDRTQTTTWELTPDKDAGAAIAIADGIRLSAGSSNSEIFIKADGPKGKKIRVFKMNKGEPISVYSSDEASDTWRVQYDNPKDIIHATQKPVELAVRAIKNHTAPGDIVVDVFAGSGGLLIAAERTDRIARIIELDTKNCDKIINRYANTADKKGRSAEIKLLNNTNEKTKGGTRK